MDRDEWLAGYKTGWVHADGTPCAEYLAPTWSVPPGGYWCTLHEMYVRHPGQAAPTWPLTCGYCKKAPATHVLVADIYFGGRMRDLVCNRCGRASLSDAMSVSKSKASAWLFVLVPAGRDDPEPAPEAAGQQETTDA